MSEQIKLDSQVLMVSRTDIYGYIEYVNGDFCKISGYSAEELIRKPHNVIRHPDMPGVIFKLMWERLKHQQDIFAVIKNMAKNGDYYWVTTHFEIRKHPIDHRITGYVAHRRPAEPHLIQEVSKLYDHLRKIETQEGLEASEKYFTQFLKDRKQTYDEYVDEIAVKKSGFKQLWGKLFGDKSE